MKRKKNQKPETGSAGMNDLKSLSADNSISDKITGMKSREERLLLLANAVSSIKECVCITDASNILIFVNDSFAKTYGYSKEELIGQNIDIVRGSNLEPDYAEKIRSSTISTGWVGEIVNKRKDGTEFPITLSTAVVHDDNGAPIALIGIASDITERKKNEDRLKNSEASYRGLFNTIHEAIYVLNEKIEFIDVNSGAEKMYGYLHSEFIGRTPEFLSAPGKNDLTKVAQLIKSTLESGESNSFEFWGMRRNGEIFPKIVNIHRGNYFGQAVVIAIGHDITAEKQHEVILKESEERYKSIFYNSTAVMLIIDPETMKIFDANNSACQYYGYTKEQITSLQVSDFNIAPMQVLNEKMKSALTRTNNYFIFEHKLSNGTIRDVEVNSSPIEFNGKRYLHSIIHDITEKRQVEKALQSERELFIGGPVTIFKWKMAQVTTTEYVSPNVKATLGYDPEEFLSNAIDFKKLIHPDDIDAAYAKSREEFKAGHMNCELLYRLKHKNGEYRWYFDFTHITANDKGEVTNAHSYLFDTTAQKEAEDALRSERELFMEGPVTVFKWNANPYADTIYVSENVKKTLGYTPEDFLSGSVNFKQLIHPDDRQRQSDEVKAYCSKGIFTYEQQYRVKRSDGTYRWYFDFTRAITNTEGVITYFHGYLFDDTARKEAQEALTHSEHELRKTNKMKDKFFSILSHDLRSPFQGLIGMASILLEDEELTSAERIEFTQKLHEGLKTQFNFIDGLLTWNRVQRGAIEFTPTTADMSRLITETISLLQNTIENKKLDLTCDIPDNVSFSFDQNMIATVLRNLIYNAVKFTRRGGKIEVIVKESSETVSCLIRDNGVGINQENLKNLWGIDTYYSTRGTDGEGGTGLGLILCKEFIEKHNGSISVESEVDMGSTFSFTLPKIRN